MNAPATPGIAAAHIPTAFGTRFEGGFFSHLAKIDGATYAIVNAPKASEFKPTILIADYKDPGPGALSYADGLANTRAWAEAGSKLAEKVLQLKCNGFEDWYIPSLDEREPAYRLGKPGTRTNWCYARSGINPHSVPQGVPYTPAFPAQTADLLFRSGGAEAFEEAIYWTSTRYAGDPECAWAQYFSDGSQGRYYADGKFRVRAVRRLLVL